MFKYFNLNIDQKNIDKLLYHSQELNLDDLTLIIQQLGYFPLNIIRVAARSPVDNRPLIAELYPLNSNDRASGV